MLGALKAVSTKSENADEQDKEEEDEEESISELALAGIKNIIQNAEVAMDLHSAVYMFHFAQALIKLVTDKEAYNTHVGTAAFI